MQFHASSRIGVGHRKMSHCKVSARIRGDVHMSCLAVGVEHIHGGLLRRTMPSFTLNQGRLRLAERPAAAQGNACMGALGAIYVTQKVSVCSCVHAWNVNMRAKGKAGRGQQRGEGGRGERRKETGRGPRKKESGEKRETDSKFHRRSGLAPSIGYRAGGRHCPPNNGRRGALGPIHTNVTLNC